MMQVSTRSHKRQMQVVYRVSPPDGVGRKGKSEWVDGSRVERRTPELLAKIKKAQVSEGGECSLSTTTLGVLRAVCVTAACWRAGGVQEAQREELEARAIEEELLARRRMEAVSAGRCPACSPVPMNVKAGQVDPLGILLLVWQRLRNQGRVLTWWEMIADAIYDMDKDGAGVSVEDMEKYVEATYDQRGKNAQKQVVNTVEAGLLDKRIVVTEVGRATPGHCLSVCL